MVATIVVVMFAPAAQGALEMRTGTSIRVATAGEQNGTTYGYVTATDWANSRVLFDKQAVFVFGYFDSFALDQTNGRLFFLHSMCSTEKWYAMCLRVWRHRGKDNTAVAPYVESEAVLTGAFPFQTYTSMAYDHVNE